MIDPDQSPSVDREADDPRFVMAAMAARRARRNRPRRLVVIAVVVLGGAAIFAAWGGAKRSVAAADLRSARIEQLAVEQLVPQYHEAQSRGGANPLEYIPDIGTRMVTYARQAGLDSPLLPPQMNEVPSGALSETTIRPGRIQNRTIEPVLQWLNRVTDEIPGIEITSLELTPNQNGWAVSVVFVKRTVRRAAPSP